MNPVRGEHPADREAGENFPVALRVLPRSYRADLHALYAYARTVDEIGDSFDGDRVARLERVGRDLERIWDGGTPDEPVLRTLARTVRARRMSPGPFRNLIAANLQDQRQRRYATFDDLRGYCRLSADPVGRMVLEVFGQSRPETVARSDEVCTALQLLEHWQDVAEDRRAGRIYLPQADLASWGVAETDLDRTAASPALRDLIGFEVERAASLLDRGAAVVGGLRGWGRISVAGYVAGGRATASALRRTGGDVLGRNASPSRAGTAAQLVRLLTAGVRARGSGRATSAKVRP